MEASLLLADIHALEEEILHFERKYGLRSEIFYAAFISGEEPEDEQWAPYAWIALWEQTYLAWAVDRAQQHGFGVWLDGYVAPRHCRKALHTRPCAWFALWSGWLLEAGAWEHGQSRTGRGVPARSAAA